MNLATPDRRATLVRAVADAGFTPGRADVAEVVELLADDDAAEHAERALLRAGAPAGPALLRRLPDARAPLRARLVHALGRIAVADPALHQPLVTCLDDPDPKARRNAISALGKLGGPEVGARLLERARDERSLPHLRSFVEALGKCGGPEALTWLEGLVADDPELARLAGRARLMLARSLGREGATSEVDLDACGPVARSLDMSCRPGLEDLLVEELAGLQVDAEALAPGRVVARLAGPLRPLLAARLWTDLAFLLPPRLRGPDLAADLVALLTGPAAREILGTYTRGQPRYRLAWAAGGHRRALVWQLAADVAAAWPDLVNDPHASTWEASADDRGRELRVALHPRKFADPRFAYRSGDVPAASHPTIAAALARVAGPRPDDVVWDPFVGSGLELCERGLLGPFAALHGTDLDPRALDVAAANLRGAGLHATLSAADATLHAPAGTTLIITNPPMGRRVHRGDVAPLLTTFLAHAARVLVRGGRLVWISPLPRVTDAVAHAKGLTLRRSLTVDMGGFTAQLQRWDRR